MRGSPGQIERMHLERQTYNITVIITKLNMMIRAKKCADASLRFMISRYKAQWRMMLVTMTPEIASVSFLTVANFLTKL